MTDLEDKKKEKVVKYNKLRFNVMKKKIGRFLRIYFKLPHIWILFIILILSFIFLIVSIYYKNDNLIFSICSNVFAGLITGLVISLISTIKEILLYVTNSKKVWLSDIHNQCLKFFEDSKRLYFFKNTDFSSEEKLYDRIYE